ncbi:hypothetical protein ANN_02743 [Periplaneta americana]|uniref:Uncharacterized protein n=1 Tax=Periplaneta americana TaxID=6978 RepID=A0ABQ8TYV3_PERAM|nr:hypothetical protein ANN_02743 [Periplaneta americana]
MDCEKLFPRGKETFGGLRRRWEDNIKMDLTEVGYDDRDWIDLAQDRDQWRAYGVRQYPLIELPIKQYISLDDMCQRKNNYCLYASEVSRAVASWSKASCLGLALRNARWFESSWGKKFSHEISVSVWDRCPPSIVMNLGSYDSYNGWGGSLC